VPAAVVAGHFLNEQKLIKDKDDRMIAGKPDEINLKY
jgi:hypothetical protein